MYSVKVILAIFKFHDINVKSLTSYKSHQITTVACDGSLRASAEICSISQSAIAFGLLGR